MSVTGEQVVAEVRRVASSNPSFVYGEGLGGSCSYFGRGIGDPTGQRCIVGQALHNLGVDMSGALEAENSLLGSGLESEIEVLINERVVAVDASVVEVLWLSQVQTNQDIGVPWGRAVAHADGSRVLDY